MSISPVGNSDAYSRYRQQALDLLASPSQVQSQATTPASPSSVAPVSTTDQSGSNPFAAKFKADLTALNQPGDGPSHAHGAHGHHHKSQDADATSTSATNLTDPSTDPTSTDTSSTDPIDQALDEFANALKAATDASTTTGV